MNPSPKRDLSTLDKAGVDALAISRVNQALRLVCAELPHLAGLAHLVRIKASRHFDVAAVSAAGLLAINPEVFARIPLTDAAFVMAHELLHLALDTHSRQGSADPHLVNMAHDFVINDMLVTELERRIPLKGLAWSGARNKSLEHLIIELSKSGPGARKSCWSSGRGRGQRRRPGKSPMRDALEKAGLVPPEEDLPPDEPPMPKRPPRGDLISQRQEAILEPEVTSEQRQQLREQVRHEAARALSLREMRAKIDKTSDQAAASLGEPQRGENIIKALQVAYAPPWQLALQRWLDAMAPAGRTYARASRRGADRDDLVLCGRYREGWCLHIVLDTSGSMIDALPKILGTIGAFCDAAGVAEVHIVQCDVEVTRDEWLEPPQLAVYKVAGFGGSDMSPGMNKLAEDHEVSAVLVLTDGYIYYPEDEPPYNVLWALFRSEGTYNSRFKPSYGEIVVIDP